MVHAVDQGEIDAREELGVMLAVHEQLRQHLVRLPAIGVERQRLLAAARRLVPIAGAKRGCAEIIGIGHRAISLPRVQR